MSSSRTLQITYVGMKSQDVPIKSGTIKVMMKSDSEVLQEVVVTGMQKWINVFLPEPENSFEKRIAQLISAALRRSRRTP